MRGETSNLWGNFWSPIINRTFGSTTILTRFHNLSSSYLEKCWQSVSFVSCSFTASATSKYFFIESFTRVNFTQYFQLQKFQICVLMLRIKTEIIVHRYFSQKRNDDTMNGFTYKILSSKIQIKIDVNISGRLIFQFHLILTYLHLSDS